MISITLQTNISSTPYLSKQYWSDLQFSCVVHVVAHYVRLGAQDLVILVSASHNIVVPTCFHNIICKVFNVQQQFLLQYHLIRFLGLAQLIVYPPSTTKAAPCTKLALLLARNRMQSATSCAVPMRPIGAIPTAGPNTSAFGLVIGVSITPGQTALTRIRSFEYFIHIRSVRLPCCRVWELDSLRRLRRTLSYL